MGHGKTLLMANIRRPGPVWVHRHVGAPRWVRRNERLLAGWKGSFVTNEPYVNRERDQRKGRKLK
jgi:hypothetical protein